MCKGNPGGGASFLLLRQLLLDPMLAQHWALRMPILSSSGGSTYVMHTRGAGPLLCNRISTDLAFLQYLRHFDTFLRLNCRSDA